MANTTEMIRLMRHAADRLAEESDMPELREAVHRLGGQSTYRPALDRLQSVAIAVTYAEVLLRMVAAAMDDESADGDLLVPQFPPPSHPVQTDVSAPVG